MNSVEGIILRRRTLGESDVFVTVLTETGEIIDLKAPGARKISSRRAPYLMDFNINLFFIHNGQKVPIITDIKSLFQFDFSHDQEKLPKLMNASEISFYFGGHQNQAHNLYPLMCSLVRTQDKTQFENIYNCFLLTALSESGTFPEVFECVKCRSELAPRSNELSLDDGGFLCEVCENLGSFPVSLSTQKILRAFARGNSLKLMDLKILPVIQAELTQIAQILLEQVAERRLTVDVGVENMNRARL